MIALFDYKGVEYEAVVIDFELVGVRLKGTAATLPYSYDLYTEAERLVDNSVVLAAEYIYDEDQNKK